MLYCGMDMHKELTYCTVVDSVGVRIRQAKLPSNGKSLAAFLSLFPEKPEILIEACCIWDHVYDALVGHGFKVNVGHPLALKHMMPRKKKTDKIDSEALANILRKGDAPLSYVPPINIRNFRELVRYRALLVKHRRMFKHKISSLLLKRGISVPYVDKFCDKGMLYLEHLSLQPIDQLQITTTLDLLKAVTLKIAEVDKEINIRAGDCKEVALLTTIPGIGVYSALLILSEIGELKRFSSYRQLSAYAGLIPSTHQSGKKEYHGKITKEGSKWLRWILVQCCQVAIKSDNKIRAYFYKQKKKKGFQKAMIATAHKMLVIIYQMLLHQEPFIDSPCVRRRGMGSPCV